MRINNLIARFLADKATKEEWEHLETWKKESQDNLNELKELHAIWHNTLDLKDYKEFDKSSAWEAINGQIESNQNVNSRKYPVVLSLKWVGGIAAAIAIVLISLNVFMNDSIQGYNSITAEQNKEQITLPDGSQIYLNRYTDLNYAENFTLNRDIILDGEAYFDVARDETNPFFINTNHAQITVLGTSFNIEETDDFSDIYVTSGSVKVTTKNEEIILVKNDMVRCGNGKIQRISSPSNNYLSWKTNLLSFNDTPLHRVTTDIARHFDIPLVFASNSKAMNLKVSDVYENQDFESIMENIVLITGITYIKEGNKYVIQ